MATYAEWRCSRRTMRLTSHGPMSGRRSYPKGRRRPAACSCYVPILESAIPFGMVKGFRAPIGCFLASAVVVAVQVLVPTAAQANPSGTDNAYAGGSALGYQYANWSVSNRRVRLVVHPTSAMDSDSCMDSMVDWQHTSGPHYDSRAVRSCNPGWYTISWNWGGSNVTNAGINYFSGLSEYWPEPSGDWNGANVNDMRTGYGHLIDDDYDGNSFPVRDREKFAGSGSGGAFGVFRAPARTSGPGC